MRNVSHETAIALETYARLLTRWQASINLISPDTVQDIWRRHIEDCLQIVDLIPESARSIVDLGSGAGLPGLILAITTQIDTVLVESNSKKAAFLRIAAQTTGAPARVLNERLEIALGHLDSCDVITARALAPLTKLLDWTHGLLKSGAIGIFPKGRTLAQEIEDAAKIFDFEYTIHRSAVEDDSTILVVTSARRRENVR